jgi:hypothetical protein
VHHHDLLSGEELLELPVDASFETRLDLFRALPIVKVVVVAKVQRGGLRSP